MASYERLTSAPTRTVLGTAERLLSERLPMAKVGEDAHSITLRGPDGTLTVSVHRHGLDTMVTAATDQLRTSRLDQEAQYFLGKLPYQPGNEPFTIGDQG